MPQTQATMTEQEAEDLAKRLERVWAIDPNTVPSWQNTQWENSFIFLATLQGGSSLDVQKRSSETYLMVELTYQLPFFLAVQLLDDGSLFPSPLSDEDQWTEFQRTEMVSFRRCCWLSGCNIEATAHEKAEWIQGFSRDEIETWNLKM